MSTIKSITLEDVERVTHSSMPDDAISKSTKKSQETAFECMEKDFEERAEQFRRKMMAIFDESEIMIMERAGQLRSGTKALFDAIQNQFGESAATVLKSYSGAGIAYRPWDFRARNWGKAYASRSVAEQIGNGVVKEVWVWYENGDIIRMLGSEELVEYCP